MTYLYHGTTMENLPLIAKYGLRWYGRGLFFFNRPDYALGHASVIGRTNSDLSYRVRGPTWEELQMRSGDYRPVVIRVDSKNLPSAPMSDFDVAASSWRIKHNIPAQILEIGIDGRWISLQQYVRSMTRRHTYITEPILRIWSRLHDRD